MTLLTEQQMAEVVEAMARAGYAESVWAGWPEPHRAGRRRDMERALTAALPAIERAVLERAIVAAKGCAWVAFNEEEAKACEVLLGDIVETIRALAGEVG
ncbi:hypothetical protein [Ancylobacter sp.]|uniref:hypothetical protein n=1 Tax=Ancylobacter sp. TaxID=1872567 RepID=UPI003BAB1B00